MFEIEISIETLSICECCPSVNRWAPEKVVCASALIRGVLVGIELDERSPAGHDGRFGDDQYFDCPNGHGIFLRPMDVIKVLKPSKGDDLPDNNIEVVPDDVPISEETISDILKPGDRVTLANDKRGVIRYIGPTELSDGKPLLGVELDQDDPTAQDGTVGSKSYFNTSMGRGVFVRRASVLSLQSTCCTGSQVLAFYLLSCCQRVLLFYMKLI